MWAPLLVTTLLAGRRPTLSARTLQSFAGIGFRPSTIANARMSLHSRFGDDEAHDQAEEVLGASRSPPTVFEPSVASFGMAVKRTWPAVIAPLGLHLKDDRMCKRPIDRGEIALCTADAAAAIRHAGNDAWRFPSTSSRKTRDHRVPARSSHQHPRPRERARCGVHSSGCTAAPVSIDEGRQGHGLASRPLRRRAARAADRGRRRRVTRRGLRRRQRLGPRAERSVWRAAVAEALGRASGPRSGGYR